VPRAGAAAIGLALRCSTVLLLSHLLSRPLPPTQGRRGAVLGRALLPSACAAVLYCSTALTSTLSPASTDPVSVERTTHRLQHGGPPAPPPTAERGWGGAVPCS
jgi:hypothetical protein